MNFSLVVQNIRDGKTSLVKQYPMMLAFISKQTDPKVLKECKAQANAIAEYLVQHGHVDVEDHNAMVKTILGIDRQLGVVLAKTVDHKGGTVTQGYTIPPGITRMQSSRTQQIARIPWKKIESRIDKETDENRRAARSRIVKELLQELARKDNEKLVEQAIPLDAIDDKFPTIVADPPWDWDDEGDVSQFGRGRHEYKAIPFEELIELPVGDRATDNAHLYLWITNRSLPKGFSLIESWGFRYVTTITWCKPSIGMGNYFRGSTEHVLFAVRGSLGLLRSDVGTWFNANRAGRHSTKPKEFYDLVESCSPGPWLELFARGTLRDGWAHWGAEAA